MNQPIQYHVLEKNLCDTMKEWELKIGCSSQPIELYYPAESLSALLQIPGGDMRLLSEALEIFRAQVQERLGALEISRKGERYCIRIPEEGSRYVKEHVKANPFLVRFLEVINQPESRLSDVEQVFYEFSDQVVKEQEEEGEYIFYFQDPEIDEYVYCVEEDEFGLEYHRFTRADYQALFH